MTDFVIEKVPRVRLSGSLLAVFAAACGGVASNSPPRPAQGSPMATRPFNSYAFEVSPEIAAPPPIDSTPQETEEPAGKSADEAGAPEPLPATPFFASVAIDGFPDAVVSLPNGANSARPVLVVLHGMGGRPDANCEAWRHIIDGSGFVLCLRGQYDPARSLPGDRRYTHVGGAYLRRHVEAGLAALQAQYPGYVDAEKPVLAGFSLGAEEVALLAQSDPPRFPRVAVLEGGVDVWFSSTIGAFASRGGKRVLFGCGAAWCSPLALAAAQGIERGGVPAHVVVANVGHTYDPPLQEAIRGELAWFFDGDDRWGSALAQASDHP